MSGADPVREELSRLVTIHRESPFPGRWDDDAWMDVLFELVEYDGWVVGLALRSLEGLSLPQPVPDAPPFTDALRKMHSPQSANSEQELALIRYAERLE